jgi:hypothetical protein
MSWEVRGRLVSRSYEHGARLKASWTSLGTVEDVLLSCGQGVRMEGSEFCERREMNAYSKPITGIVHWDDDVEVPEVVLEWTEGGEPCTGRFPIRLRSHHLGRPAVLQRTVIRRARRAEPHV